jgi:hypothetical protein
MFNYLILTLSVLIGTITLNTSAIAQVDCSQLDPRASMSREMEGKLKISVDTLYKIAKAGGSIEGKIKDEIQNLQKDAPVTEQGQIRLRTLYLFCGMVANARDISTERKVELYKIMMEEKNTKKIKTQRPTQKKKSKDSSNKTTTAAPSEEQKITKSQNIPPPNTQTNTTISSQEQSGGITAHTVNITEQVEPETAKYVGKLEPNTKLILSANDHVFPQLELGDGGAKFLYAGPEGKPLFNILGDNLTIISHEGQVKISTVIRNKNGVIVAELINNEWKVKSSNWDRNYSKDALEVKDDTGDIILQVRVLEDRIQFQGKFYDSQGNGVALGKYSNGKGGIIERTGVDHPRLELKIEPIFQYPSDNHLGDFLSKKQ